MPGLRNIFFLLFSPRRFLNVEVQHARARQESPSQGYSQQAREAIARKRKGMGFSFLLVLALLGMGWILAYAINSLAPLSEPYIDLCRLLSSSIVAWAVLGRSGSYETETWKAATLLERTSESTFQFFYGLGLVLTAAAFLFEPVH